MRYVVYTKIHKGNLIENWYYGVYNSEERANDVAYELGQDRENMVFHSICAEDEVDEYHILNLPDSFTKNVS